MRSDDIFAVVVESHRRMLDMSVCYIDNTVLASETQKLTKRPEPIDDSTSMPHQHTHCCYVLEIKLHQILKLRHLYQNPSTITVLFAKYLSRIISIGLINL